MLQPRAIGSGQPVEQFGMGGSAPSGEITRSRDDPPPEVILPQAVDKNPRRQRMIRTSDPRASAAHRPEVVEVGCSEKLGSLPFED